MDGVLWSGTAAGGTDVKPCPNGARGKSKKMPFKFYMYALSLHSKLHIHSKKMASHLQDCCMGLVF